MKASLVLHRHIFMGPESDVYPRDAQFAKNGKRFQAAEGLDFNSLYERDKINLKLRVSI